jgi:hypothetical protein
LPDPNSPDFPEEFARSVDAALTDVAARICDKVPYLVNEIKDLDWGRFVYPSEAQLRVFNRCLEIMANSTDSPEKYANLARFAAIRAWREIGSEVGLHERRSSSNRTMPNFQSALKPLEIYKRVKDSNTIRVQQDVLGCADALLKKNPVSSYYSAEARGRFENAVAGLRNAETPSLPGQLDPAHIHLRIMRRFRTEPEILRFVDFPDKFVELVDKELESIAEEICNKAPAIVQEMNKLDWSGYSPSLVRRIFDRSLEIAAKSGRRDYQALAWEAVREALSVTQMQ